MSRIEDSVFQDDIANSLLGDEQQSAQPEQEESEYAASGNVLTDQHINDSNPEGVGMAARMRYGDAVVDDRIRKNGGDVPGKPDDIFSGDELKNLSRDERLQRTIEREEENNAKATEQSREQARPEMTVEQFQPIVEQTNKAVQDLGLIEAPKLAADLAPYFAAPTARHEKEIGLLVGGLTLSSAQVLTQLYRDGELDASKPMEFEKLPQLSSVACNYLSAKWCEFRGQSAPARDPIGVGIALQKGFANLIHSKGKTDPQMAVMWCEAVEKYSTGRDVKIDEKEAMGFVNALTPHVRSAVQKLNPELSRWIAQQAKPQKGIARMTSAKKYDGIRTPTVRKEVRQITKGLGADTLAAYQREHGKL